MTLVEFLQKRFNFDATAEIPENDPPVVPEKEQNNTIPPISTVETQTNTNTGDNPLADEIESLRAEVASLKQANAKLAAGKSIDQPSSKSVEEILYGLYLGGKNGNNKNN